MEWKFRFDLFEKEFSSLLEFGDSLSKIAKEIGVSKATLSRVRQGKTVDVNTLINIHEWMMENRHSKKGLNDYIKHVLDED